MGDLLLTLGLGRSPGEGNGNLLQYSCLENSTDRGSSPWGCRDRHHWMTKVPYTGNPPWASWSFSDHSIHRSINHSPSWRTYFEAYTNHPFILMFPLLVFQQHSSVLHVQFRSVTQSRPTLCDPMNCNTPGLPVHHQLPEFTRTHVYWIGDALRTDLL